MASEAHSGNILDFTTKYQRNKFEDKTFRIGGVEVVFDGFISSRRGAEMHSLLQNQKPVESIMHVMKHPDEEQARALVDAIEDGVPYSQRIQAMGELLGFILGEESKDDSPNS